MQSVAFLLQRFLNVLAKLALLVELLRQSLLVGLDHLLLFAQLTAARVERILPLVELPLTIVHFAAPLGELLLHLGLLPQPGFAKLQLRFLAQTRRLALRPHDNLAGFRLNVAFPQVVEELDDEGRQARR